MQALPASPSPSPNLPPPSSSPTPAASAPASPAQASADAVADADNGTPVAADSFGTLLANQIKGKSKATVGDGVLPVLEGDGKDDAAASNPLQDLLALASSGVIPVAVQPTDRTVDPAGENAAQGEISLLKTAASAQLSGLVKEGGGTESGQELHKAAELAGDGKQLPRLALEPSVPEMEIKPENSEQRVTEKPQMDFSAMLDQAQTGNPNATAQTNSASNAQTANASRDLTLSPKVGAPEWGNALGEKVTWMANQGGRGSQVAELHLNPPNLGPLEVRLTVNNDQATAMFVSHHPAVRDAIETALPRLREMLADNGIMLGNTSVGAESFQQQQQAFADASGQNASGRPPLFSDSPDDIVMGGGLRPPTRSSGVGLVDTFA